MVFSAFFPFEVGMLHEKRRCGSQVGALRSEIQGLRAELDILKTLLDEGRGPLFVAFRLHVLARKGIEGAARGSN